MLGVSVCVRFGIRIRVRGCDTCTGVVRPLSWKPAVGVHTALRMPMVRVRVRARVGVGVGARVRVRVRV